MKHKEILPECEKGTNRAKLQYCNGKPCYDKRSAVTAANKRFRENHTKLRIYQCDQGDHWHLTHKI